MKSCEPINGAPSRQFFSMSPRAFPLCGFPWMTWGPTPDHMVHLRHLICWVPSQQMVSGITADTNGRHGEAADGTEGALGPEGLGQHWPIAGILGHIQVLFLQQKLL